MQSNMSKRKALYIVLSLVVAMAIWVYVDISGDRNIKKTFTNVPVEFLDEDTVLAERGLMLLEDGTTTSIDLTLSGSRWNIARLDPNELRVQVSLADITTTGSQLIKYTIRYPDGLSSSFTTSDASAYMIRVNIGELNTRTVDVKAEIVGSVAEGYTAGELLLSPAQLEIRGQPEDIDPVSYAKVTINLDNAESTFTGMLDYQFYDANDHLLDSTGIHATVDQVQATLPVNVTKELKLVVDFIESPGARASNLNYTIEPETITVCGDAEKLRDVDSITLTSFDLTKLSSATLYNYTIPLPEGCENLSGVTTATFRASFKDRTSATLTTSKFSLRNLPEGKDVSMLTEKLTVTVFGTSEDVASLTGSDLEVIVDLADFGSAAGGYTVPATVRVKNGADVGVSGTYQVRVTIQDNASGVDTGSGEESGEEEPAQ